MAGRIHQPMEGAEFDFILAKSTGPVLAFFCGAWPKAVEVCRQMDCLVRELVEEYGDRLTAVKVDMTRCPEPTRRFHVTSAPTFLLIKQKERVAVWQGPLALEGLREFVAPHA
ncbi:co-chaperone YbbN [Streptomyces sp. N35]|uniref:thioredoxin family protein n=1 Tax=Streptomyces sp. N35 TaxID=2795730 RepID=UPI0018F61BBB|nr:thioredoxin family protein [Streptomyces sp. N35]